jgi:glycosidase
MSRWARRTLVAATLALSAVASCTGTRKTPRPPVYPVESAGPWWQKGVCYEVFVRSFYDSDGDGVGDLNGLTARLDYINDGNPASTRSLGANCIWLMPIAKAASYHGYDVIDYYHVDPHYGTDDDFRKLVAEAHRRGIHVIVDFVPNHSSSENPWFQSAMRGPGSPYRDWYRWSSESRSEKGPWGQEVWHKSPARNEHYYGLFWGGMPDLNYETPALMQEMLKVTRYWITDMHADGFRFDAVPYLVEDGGRIEHTSGTHEVLRKFGSSIRSVAPQSFTVGEMSDPDPRILASYYPDQLDAYFAYGVAFATVDAARTGNAAGFIRAVSEANTMLPARRWLPFLTNHDHIRVMTQLGGNAAAARVAAGAMLMLPGMPFVYYGEEIGMLGDKPDETIRNPMQWSSAPNGGFTSGTPWETLQPDWRTKNVAAQDSDSTSLLNHYRRLIRLRNSYPGLSSGSLTMIATGDTTGAIAAWLRRSEREAFLIMVNFGERHTQVRIPDMRSILRTHVGRPERVYADPTDTCAGTAMTGDNSVEMLASVAARSVCVLRIRLP